MRNSTTDSPVKLEHFDKLRCVSRAVSGIEWSAESVILVCATSRWVSFESFGNRFVKIVEGRMVHSCRLNLVMGRNAGSGDSETVVKASRKDADEQAQKSTACSFGILNSAERTSTERSSSTCSCAKNSLKFGTSFRHCRSVSGMRFKVICLSLAVNPAPVGLKCEKSSLRTIVPREGWMLM